MTSMFFGLSNSPFNDPLSTTTFIIVGIIFILGAILNLIVYIVKPERLKKKALAK